MSRTKDAEAHPFPFQIALQTQEFLQGALFHALVADIAAGEFVRQPGGTSRIDQIMHARGLRVDVGNQSWMLLRKYQHVFEGIAFQSVLIGLNSHWDWYIRRLSEFIRFARSSVGSSTLSSSDEKRLRRVERLPLDEQLVILELAIGVNLSLAAVERQELKEMSLVRNIGLHNRWETDVRYLKETTRQGLQVGELRVVGIEELQSWHSLLIKLLLSSASECAKRFNGAPDFLSNSI
jgi:hypothetical protein